VWELTDADFVQARALWRVLGRQDGQQGNFVGNVSGHLCAAREGIRRRVYAMFGRVDEELGRLIEEKTEERVRKKVVEMAKL